LTRPVHGTIGMGLGPRAALREGRRGGKDNFSLFAAGAPGTFIDFGTKTNVLVGGTIGAGIEYAFAPHWTAKIEYNYVDLGSNTENFNIVTGGVGGTLTFREDIEHKINILKFGANYKF